MAEVYFSGGRKDATTRLEGEGRGGSRGAEEDREQGNHNHTAKGTEGPHKAGRQLKALCSFWRTLRG
jgi:hypothetical protein